MDRKVMSIRTVKRTSIAPTTNATFTFGESCVAIAVEGGDEPDVDKILVVFDSLDGSSDG